MARLIVVATPFIAPGCRNSAPSAACPHELAPVVEMVWGPLLTLRCSTSLSEAEQWQVIHAMQGGLAS